MYYIEKGLKPKQLSLFLTKPNKNRTTIAKLTHAYNKKLSVKFGNVNELSFTLPYSITIKNKIVRNPYIDEIKEKYFIRAEFGDSIEYFLINKLSKSSGDTDELNVQCFSLGYQLTYQRMIDYQVTSYNCLQVLTDCLKGTGWTVGYINVDLNLKFRKFDVSSKTKLDFLYEIAETFEGVVNFDTVEKKINIYKEEEISKYKGFWIKYGKYLENVEETIDSDEIVTRLYVKGGDDLSINAVNPTGQSYIDDFSYFLYPFQMDDKGNVISHSNFMSDELCIALINYNSHISSRKDEFKSLLDQKKTKQEEKTQRENELNQLNNDLQIILDAIQVAKDAKQSTKDLISKRDTKIKEIEGKKKVISEIDSTIKSIDNSITALKDDLKMENHLSPDEMDELTNYIQVDEWSDENKIDENDLYEDALKKIGEINSPPINISVGIINFFEIVEEQRNWDRLNIGDIVKIKHDKLNIFVQTKITQIDYDFESASINLTISNTKKIKSTLEKINDAIYKIGRVNTEFNNRKIDWNKAAYNFNLRNDRISETPTTPTIAGISHKENDNGSVNLTVNWDYPDFNKTNKNEDNIDGFLIYLHADQTNETYMFGSKMASETKVDVTYGTKTYTFPSVPSNLFYTIGVRAYRRVDEDVNTDGILLSDIATSSKSSENPYQPSTVVNVNARLNGVKYTVSKTEPSSPQIDDVWANPEDAKIRIWNGTEWKIDKSVEQSKEYTDKVINESKGQLQKEIEDAMKEVDDAMKVVDSEVDRINNEVVPRINEELKNIDNAMINVNNEVNRINDEVVPRVNKELEDINLAMANVDKEVKRIDNEVVPKINQTLDEINIPKQNTPPDPIPLSGLWIDTSVNPPRMMQYDKINNKWLPIAPTKDEVIEFTQEYAQKKVSQQQAPPTNPSINDLWIDTSGQTYVWKQWNGTEWVKVSITNFNELTGQLQETQIAVGAIKTDHLFDGAVVSKKLADAAVTLEKIGENAVDTTKIIDDAITQAKIAMGAVGANEIASNAVTAGKIDANAITAREIKAGTITANEIAANTITSNLISTLGLDAGVIKFGTMHGDRITAGTITASRLNVNEIFANSAVVTKIQTDIVKTTELDATKITTGTLDALKVDVQNLSASKITTGTLDASKVTVSNLSATSITSGTLDALKVTVKNLSADTILTGTLDASKVLVKNLSATNIIGGTLDALKVSVVNLSASNIIAGEIDASKILVKNLSASNIISGTLKSIDIQGVNITGSKVESSSSLGKVILENGEIKSFKGSDRVMSVDEEGLKIWQPNNLIAGTLRGESTGLNTYGIELMAHREYLSLGFRESGTSNNNPWIEMRRDSATNYTAIYGGNRDGSDYGDLRLYSSAGKYLGNGGGVPRTEIRNYNTDYKWAGIINFIGRDYDAQDDRNGERFSFEVWQYNGTGNRTSSQLFKVDKYVTNIYSQEAYLPSKTYLKSGNQYDNALGIALNQSIQVHGVPSANPILSCYEITVTYNPGSGYTSISRVNVSGAKYIWSVFVQLRDGKSNYFTVTPQNIDNTGFDLWITINDGVNRDGYAGSQIKLNYMVLMQRN